MHVAGAAAVARRISASQLAVTPGRGAATHFKMTLSFEQSPEDAEAHGC